MYVFRRVTSGWRQEAYLKAGVNQVREWFGNSLDRRNKTLAINADGTLLAVGARGLDTPGIGDAGVVYIYQRSSSGSWSLAATLNPPAPVQLEGFGVSIDMSLDGRTLKVDSAAPFDDFGPEFGALRYSTHIFVRSGSTWQHSVTFTPDDDEFCKIVRLSGDGNTLLSDCEASLTGERRLRTRKRTGNTWTPHIGSTAGYRPIRYPRGQFRRDHHRAARSLQGDHGISMEWCELGARDRLTQSTTYNHSTHTRNESSP